MKEYLNNFKDYIKNHKAIFIALVAVIVIYISGVLLFSFKTYPRTYVNGAKVGMQSRSSVFMHDKEGMTLKVKGEFDEELEIKAKDIELKYSIKKAPALNQNPFAWPVQVFLKHDYDVEYDKSYDKTKLSFLILESKFDENGSMPTNAHLQVEGTSVSIVPEKFGTRIKMDKLEELIVDALSKDISEITVKDAYVAPKVLSDNPELLKSKETMENIVKTRISFDMGDRDYAIEGETLISLYEQKEDGTYEFSKEKLSNWISKMAEETDTYGTKRKFTTTDGNEITVEPGIYGWQIDVEGTTEEVLDLIKEGGVHEGVKPEYNVYGYERNTNDIGKTYVEINLSKQHIWVYVDGALIVDSGIVSGTTHKYATPVGVNKLWSKEKDQILEGRWRPEIPVPEGLTKEEEDKLNYHAHVDFWMPIDWGGIGLHDADWVSSFGDNTYEIDGSHGCINLPRSTAEKIFNEFPVGAPVITYESGTNYSSPCDY